MRISFDALRLCALVAAGAASGYLWRAAFESSTPEVRVAATPRVVHPAPAPKIVRIPPSRFAPHKVVAHHVARRTHRATPAASLLASHPIAVAPVAPTPAPQSSPPPPKPQPKPAPPPAPAPSPTPGTSPPATSAPVQTQTTPTTPTAPTAPTAQAAAAPPKQPEPPSNQPNLGNSTSDTRPGWGKGDKNHDHTGPGNGP